MNKTEEFLKLRNFTVSTINGKKIALAEDEFNKDSDEWYVPLDREKEERLIKELAELLKEVDADFEEVYFVDPKKFSDCLAQNLSKAKGRKFFSHSSQKDGQNVFFVSDNENGDMEGDFVYEIGVPESKSGYIDVRNSDLKCALNKNKKIMQKVCLSLEIGQDPEIVRFVKNYISDNADNLLAEKAVKKLKNRLIMLGYNF